MLPPKDLPPASSSKDKGLSFIHINRLLFAVQNHTKPFINLILTAPSSSNVTKQPECIGSPQMLARIAELEASLNAALNKIEQQELIINAYKDKEGQLC